VHGKYRFFAGLIVLATLSGTRYVWSAEQQTGSAARAAIARGLDWLQKNQQENGSWSSPKFPALTALPLWAICGSAETNRLAMADRATAFIVSCAQTNGGIYVDNPDRQGGGLPNYNTAICMTALHATGRKDLLPVILGARGYMSRSQYLEDDINTGGFGYDRAAKRPYTDLDNTFFSMEAMRRTQDVEDMRPADQRRADINWAAALAYVSKMQNPAAAGTNDAGGFIYNSNDPKAGAVTNAAGTVYLRSYGSITYAGLLSLIYADVARTDPRVISAVDFAARHWTLEENPGMGQQGVYFYYMVMGRALATARIDRVPRAQEGGGDIAWRDELIRKLISLQRADGSWGNSNNRFWEGDPVLATSYALLSLEFASGITK